MNNKDIIKRYSDAKEIHALMRKKKLSKKEVVFDWIITLFTPLPGVVDDADFVSDMGAYYLVVGENSNKLVRVMGKDVTEQEISVNTKKRIFAVNGIWFVMVGKLNG